jgi:carbonic anhydrase
MRRSALAVLLSVVAVFSLGLAPAGVPSGDEALRNLMEGNKRFVGGTVSAKTDCAARRNTLMGGQQPAAIVVTCSDSRVAPEIIFDRHLGDIFVIRVAGNVVDPLVLGSIEYAAEHLHTPLLVLMGHEKCGAVAAAVDAHGATEGNIGAILKEILPAVKAAKAKGGGRDDVLLAAIRENIAQTYGKMLKDSTVLKHLIEKGELKAVGAMYHLGTGEVEVLKLEADAPAAKPEKKKKVVAGC